MVKRIKISKVVSDYNFYPRQYVNSYHADEIVEALKAGVHMPPITVDKSSYRVIDGWHRIEASRRLWGGDAEIDADLKEYASEAEMFQDAIRLNASHGQSLSRIDEAHCLAKAKEFQLEQAVVATLLNITMERAEELVSNRLAISPDGPIVLKGSTAFLAGRRLTQEQVDYNKKAGGLPQTFYINQVIAMLEGDSVNWDNVRVISGLKKLSELLKTELKPVSSVARRG
ncbi:unnamed protein product [marine sediment metagenome]|uniref:Uncharacterized protein n=1 Tax=marine sediment metagenome TaxID=412755 RepID=X1E2Q0_9ZZZZ